MFDRALTAAEVFDHYNASLAASAGVPEPGTSVLILFAAGLLLARWRR
jgi:hypothetical protein